VEGRLSYSVGQFHYQTDGFRENNDLELDIYNVFAQMNLSHKTSVQAEYRYTDREQGDLPLRFDPTNYYPTLRQDGDIHSARAGLRHAFSPHSDLIASFIYRSGDFDTRAVAFDFATEADGYIAEVQHLCRSELFHVTGGVGHFDEDVDLVSTFFPLPPEVEKIENSHTNLYVYSHLNYPKNVTWSVGGSADFYEGALVERDQFNPKFGLTWRPFPGTTLRGALFRVLNRTLISNQTIEPTQVAGFNQFFEDTGGTQSWRYGGAIDQKLSAALYGGVEFSWRDIELPFLFITLPPAPPVQEIHIADWEERMGRAYLYWAPHPWLAVSGEYQYERFERDPAFVGPDLFTELKTHRLPVGINFFHPCGLSAWVKGTYVDQEGEFGDPEFGPVVPGDDQFWVVDVSFGYRLPRRWGLLTVEVRNLFDEEFRFQDMDAASPRIYPERLVSGRITLAF